MEYSTTNLLPNFLSLRRKSPPPGPPAPWPTAQNPCPTPSPPAHCIANLFDVHGVVTKLCVGCLWRREEQWGDRRRALATFRPDRDGRLVLPEK